MHDIIGSKLAAIRDALHLVADAHCNREPFAAIDDGYAVDAHPMAWLHGRLGLTETEQRVLWILVAHELCPVSRRYLRELDGDPGRDVAIDTIRRTVYGAPDRRCWQELGDRGALQRFGLIELDAQKRTIRVAPRVLALAHGDDGLDPALASCATLDVPRVPLADLAVDGDAVARVRAAMANDGLVLVHGAPGSGRRSLLVALAARPVLQVDCRSLATERDDLRRQLRAIAREALLLQVTPLLLHLDALAAVGDVPDRLDLVERELSGLVLATAARAISRRWRQPPTAIALPALLGAQLAAFWRRTLPDASTADAELLATMYPLAPALVESVGAVARREAAAQPMRPEHIEAGVRAVLDDRLAGLATRITVTQTWNDLVLPDEQTTAVVELLARIRRRRRVYEDWGFAQKLGKGLGVSALFSGPPGTGKTMCAGLVARDLGTELYQVDVSKIASKWIGETEKNLAALFDAAEAGHAILLFDEADALFGKRTTVTSSNDHHANQQVNFLLQRLESFSGICILTTNNDNALDEAFRRRLSIHIRFPVPDTDERTRLWQALLPARAPVEPDLAFAELARKYVMSGGYIRNAVLRAAFLAADEDGAITNYHLAQAAQLEYEAMGKLAAA